MTHKTVPIEATNEMWQAAFDIYGTQFHEDQMQSHILCIQAMYREMVAHAPPDNTVQELREQVAELVEALGEARDEVANQASAAQQLLPYKTHRYEAYVTQLANIDALLTRAKEYLK